MGIIKLSYLISLLIIVISQAKFISAGYISCENGGELLDGSCICPPNYTGEQCEVELTLVGDDQKVAELRENIQGCYDPQVRQSIDVGSGSGSGEGSGVEEPTLTTTLTCSNPEKRPLDGKCEFADFYHGYVFLKKNLTSDQTQCMLTLLVDYVRQSTNYYDIEVDSEPTELEDVALRGLVLDKNEDNVISIATEEIREYVRSNMALVYQYKVSAFDDVENFVVPFGALQYSEMVILASLSDQDECETETDRCDDNSTCTNSYGSYTCECFANYTDVSDEDERAGTKCRHVCLAEHGSDEPYCLNEGKCHITMEEKGVCECPLGYAGDRCEDDWHIFLNATIGLTVALGIILVIFVFVTLMLCFRAKLNKSASKAEIMEMESAHSVNGEYNQPNDDEIKGISNPYVSSDEGITVATNSKLDDEPDVEEDRL